MKTINIAASKCQDIISITKKVIFAETKGSCGDTTGWEESIPTWFQCKHVTWFCYKHNTLPNLRPVRTGECSHVDPLAHSLRYRVPHHGSAIVQVGNALRESYPVQCRFGQLAWRYSETVTKWEVFRECSEVHWGDWWSSHWHHP